MSGPLNLLVAYPYFKADTLALLKQHERSSYRLIIDSGAFTAWNTGKEIELDSYCRFLDSIQGLRPFNAVVLDVIGNAEQSHQNYLTMRRRGYDVMPVFTRGDSLERLEEYYAGTNYILLGGVAFGRGNSNYVKWFSERNKGRKCHWLGFTNSGFIKKYRPTSVDSSSWMSMARFGGLALYGGGGSVLTRKKTDFARSPSNETLAGFARIGMNGGHARCLAQSAAWTGAWSFDGVSWDRTRGGQAQFIATCSHLKRAVEIERRLGTQIYMVGNNGAVTRYLFMAREHLIRAGVWS